jgi:hypothetical protein
MASELFALLHFEWVLSILGLQLDEIDSNEVDSPYLEIGQSNFAKTLASESSNNV